MSTLFYTKPAQIIMFLAMLVILVTQYSKFSALILISQVLTYLAIAYNAECLAEGGCNLWAWLSVALPILYSLAFLILGRQMNLISAAPAPIVSVLPLYRSSEPEPEPTASNSSITAEPANGTAQPTTTTGNINNASSV